MKILLLDDNEGILSPLGYLLDKPDVEIFKASDIDTATAICMQHIIDHLVFDIDLKDTKKDGFTFAYHFKKLFPEAQMHILTGLEKYTIPEDLRDDIESVNHKPHYQSLQKAIFGHVTTDTEKIKIILDQHTEQMRKFTFCHNQTEKRVQMLESDMGQVLGDIKDMKTVQQANHQEIIKKFKNISTPSFKALAGIVGGGITTAILIIWGIIVWQLGQTEKMLIMRMDLKDKIIEQQKSMNRYNDSLKYTLKGASNDVY